MKKFGCFFTKEIFSNIFMSRFDNSINHDDTKKTMVKNIEKYFYQQIRNRNFINPRKHLKLLMLQDINKKFLDNFYVLNKYRDNKLNYYKYYELSINNDLDKEETLLNNEIQKQDESMKKLRRQYERLCREREEEEREIEEEKERRRPAFLKTCENCRNICLFCKGKILGVAPSGFVRPLFDYKAHGTCIPNEYSCCICGKKKGTRRCDNQCYYCFESLRFIKSKCYYVENPLIIIK
jgi:hypothetical protein